VTVLEVIQKSADFLSRKSVDSPRLQAELLLAHVLKLPRMKLYLNFERKLVPAEEDAMREFVKRRGQREPLQHIVGSTSFCGYEIAVNRNVLVPRPETEMLAELGWEFLNGLKGGTSNVQRSTSNAKTTLSRPTGEGEASNVVRGSSPAEGTDGQSQVDGKISALDFGTGSGCIAIALAAKCPLAQVTALDISAEALGMAKQNATQNGVGERIIFLQGDGFAALGDLRSDAPRSGLKFDLIISNPPYIPAAEVATLQAEVRDFDPRGALDGGADGLDFYRSLAAQAPAFLKPGGTIMLEFGDGQVEAIGQIFAEQKWIVESVKEDYSRRPRILIAQR
jgi:release factor glutamine methyltransferase